MKTRILIGVMVVLASLIVARPAMAQDDVLFLTVAAGPSWLHEGGGVDQTAVGAAIDAAVNLLRSPKLLVAALVDIGFNKFEGCTEKSFGPGGRVGGRVTPKVTVFGQFVISKVKCGEFELDFGKTTQPGFGVDYLFGPALDLRVQFDLRRLSFSGGDSETEKRFWVGISFHTKRK